MKINRLCQALENSRSQVLETQKTTADKPSENLQLTYLLFVGSNNNNYIYQVNEMWNTKMKSLNS